MIIIRPLQENGIYFSFFKNESQIDSENSELHPKGSSICPLILTWINGTLNDLESSK